MSTKISVEEKNLILLCKILAALEDPEEARLFLTEICTPQEIKTLAKRVAAAELRIQGFTNESIIDMLRREDGTTISSATISRVSDMLQKGKGVLRMIILRVSDAEGC